MLRVLGVFGVLMVFAVPACRERSEPMRDDGIRLAAREASAPVAVPQSCAERMRAALADPAMPGVPVLDTARVRLLAAAKGEPVLFVRRPRRQLEPGSRATIWAKKLDATRFPWDVVHRLLPAFSAEPAFARAVVLREGYLYAETPELAFALVDQLAVQHLFRDARIWVQRGESMRFAVRSSSGRYVWESGSDAGKPVSLLLFDRLGSGAPAGALTRDLRSLRYRTHFDRARIRHVTDTRIVVDFRHGERWVETLLSSNGAKLDIECENLPPEEKPFLELWRDRAARRARIVHALQSAMLEQIDEGIAFDEPMTELGQQDGRLRPIWLRAYLEGATSYRFNVDRYPVFDPKGRPIPPQICLDFLTDTLERASGTWWRRLGEPRERVHGRLDFEDYGGLLLRSVERFSTFAARQSDWFEIKSIPEREQIPIGKLDALIDYLVVHADDFQAGDMVFIRGWTPWDPREPHYHSFFVYESDPITGFPMAIAGNAGRPSIRVWRTESLRTPRRLFAFRIRPRLEWLERIVTAPSTNEAETAPPLGAAAPS